VLIKKYGTGGSHAEKNKQALERLKAARKAIGPVSPPPPAPKPKPKQQEPAPSEQPAEAEAAVAASGEEGAE
jgi:small subunit ribosomal protein S16